jgi:hypothetical protein
MSKLILHFVNGEWKGFEAPEENLSDIVFEQQRGKKKKWLDDEWKKARANALKVLNPEIAKSAMIGPPLEGQEYDWTGSYEIIHIDEDNIPFVVLSLPSKETKEETQDILNSYLVNIWNEVRRA